MSIELFERSLQVPETRLLAREQPKTKSLLPCAVQPCYSCYRFALRSLGRPVKSVDQVQPRITVQMSVVS